jgi:hypothetical protein
MGRERTQGIVVVIAIGYETIAGGCVGDVVEFIYIDLLWHIEPRECS